MAKRIKMMIYGEPGVGKSVFASKAPRPFFITTDGNYEWLEDWGAKPEDHKQVFSWDEAKKAFAESYDNYDTIVVDLLEDLFKWCEQEYCIKGKIDHVSDVGFGKGYDITRNEFFLELSKLLGKDKNIIFISHGITFVTKDRRGVDHTRYAPSSRIPDKVLDMIEGRLRYCLRCYLKGEETKEGTIEKKRYLSLVPKENEFGIIRGVDENKIPQDIPLDWDEFVKAIGYTPEPVRIAGHEAVLTVADDIVEPKKDMEVVEEQIERTQIKTEADDIADAQKQVEEATVPRVYAKYNENEQLEVTGIKMVKPGATEVIPNDKPPFDVEEPQIEKAPVETKVVEETVVEEKVEVEEKPTLTTSKADAIAAIRAKLAAMKAGK